MDFKMEVEQVEQAFGFNSLSSRQTKVAVDSEAIHKAIAPASKQVRSRLFSQCDVNGNGILSSAEVEQGLKEILNSAGAAACIPAITRAFQAALDFAPAVAIFPGRVVDKNQFRVLLVYLQHYIDLYRAVGSHQITLQQFQTTLPLLVGWGMKQAAIWHDDHILARGAFNAMYKAGAGAVSLDVLLRVGLHELLMQGLGPGEVMQDRAEAFESYQKAQAAKRVPTQSMHKAGSSGPTEPRGGRLAPSANAAALLVEKASLLRQASLLSEREAKVRALNDRSRAAVVAEEDTVVLRVAEENLRLAQGRQRGSQARAEQSAAEHDQAVRSAVLVRRQADGLSAAVQGS